MVEDLLGERPPLRGGGKNEYAGIKLTWLRERVRRAPEQAMEDALRQYARCYILLMIGPQIETPLTLPVAHRSSCLGYIRGFRDSVLTIGTRSYFHWWREITMRDGWCRLGQRWIGWASTR
ncbi:hypothetical protein PIB30_024931 [Stylosanthes scabra]|uniref:Uncharacterized protein n=1 Tax=Stylosanthes scabra TaxID=79078 RepID=A0ABU6UBS2_9FABA|nr:hypothetical protein [Stylosanthes scabra]